MGVLFVIPGLVDSGLGAFVYAVIFAFYAVLFILGYGMPVSILSDWIAKHISLTWLRIVVSFIVHVGFGTIPFLLGSLYFDGLLEGIAFVGLGAVIYWVVSFILALKKPINYRVTWRLATPSILVTILVMAVYFVQAIDDIGEPVIYEIPENYRGIVKIYYNDKEELPLKKDGHYLIAPINEKGILKTSTSTPSGVYTYKFVNEQGEEVVKRQNLLHFDNVLTSEFEYEGEYDQEINSFFVGTKEEAEKYYKENERVYTADFRSEAIYHLYMPESFRGWAVVSLGEETETAEQKPYPIHMNDQGVGTFSLSWIDYQPQADKFFFVQSTGEAKQITKEMIHEPMLYPDLFAVFVGTKQEYKNSEPFHYITYKEKLSQYNE